jgi:type II secretory pathway pseudopilin PulG
MHPYSTQAVAAQRARDLREQAAAARRATEARRARRGHGPIAAGRGLARRTGAPRWA